MNGLILADKPSGISSFGAVAAIRRIYSEKRAGHTGTLDPLATGVLPVLIGRATRLCGYVTEQDKRYLACIRLGMTTDTLDITGKVISENAVDVSDKELGGVLRSFIGEYMQVPPMYSAIKKNGKKLYELARSGEEIVREPRKVRINFIDLIERNGSDLTVDVGCSKGTYIRSLADDIGRALGCGAVMTALRRTETAGFSISDCASLEMIESDPKRFLLPAHLAVPQFGNINITAKQAERFMNGGELSADRINIPDCGGEIFKVFGNKEFLGLGELDEAAGSLRVKCVIAER